MFPQAWTGGACVVQLDDDHGGSRQALREKTWCRGVAGAERAVGKTRRDRDCESR